MRSRLSYSLAALTLAAMLFSMLAPAHPARAHRSQAPAASGVELVQLVNQLRVENGLPPFQVNQALMSAAQAHSEYQASIAKITHTGAGGTRPRDRAAAAGYGGGAEIFISENIAVSSRTTTAAALEIWQTDSLHLNTMLSSDYQDVGAGVAEAGGMTYFTLDVGYIGDSQTPPAAGPNETTAPGVTGTPDVNTVTVVPMIVSTPRPDGSVIHVVQPGQTLSGIAAIYKVSLADIYAFNGMTDKTVIFPGDKLMVKAAQTTPTLEASAAVSATLFATLQATPVLETPTPTRRPTRTLSSASSTQPVQTSTPAAPIADNQPEDPEKPQGRIDPLLAVIGGLVVLGSAFVLLGTVLKKG